MLAKILIFLLCVNFNIIRGAEDDETTVTHKIEPDTKATETTEATTTTTEDLSKIVFDKPEIVSAEITEAWGDLDRTVQGSIDNFMKYSKEKLENEVLRLFSDLEKVDSYDKFEKLCPHGMVTAYEEFQTANDGLSSRWILIEHGKIDDLIAEIYKNFLTPFQQKVRSELESPITTKLRYPKGNKDKYVVCAKKCVPMIIIYIESAFTNVIDCLVMKMNYNDTLVYQETITKMYEETAGFITTCNGNIPCLKKYCPKFHFLVLKTVLKASNAMTGIMTNFRTEIANIITCTKNKFNDKQFTTNLTSIASEIKSCFS